MERKLKHHAALCWQLTRPRGLALVAAIGVTTLAPMARQAQPASVREYRVGGIRLKLPVSLQQLETQQLGIGDVAIFGEKDDCNKFFQRYLAIFVAVDNLSESEIVPTGGYRVLSRLHRDYV